MIKIPHISLVVNRFLGDNQNLFAWFFLFDYEATRTQQFHDLL